MTDAKKVTKPKSKAPVKSKKVVALLANAQLMPDVVAALAGLKPEERNLLSLEISGAIDRIVG